MVCVGGELRGMVDRASCACKMCLCSWAFEGVALVGETYNAQSSRGTDGERTGKNKVKIMLWWGLCVLGGPTPGSLFTTVRGR